MSAIHAEAVDTPNSRLLVALDQSPLHSVTSSFNRLLLMSHHEPLTYQQRTFLLEQCNHQKFFPRLLICLLRSVGGHVLYTLIFQNNPSRALASKILFNYVKLLNS